MDQGSNCCKVRRGNLADTGVYRKARDQVILGQPDLLYRVIALQIKHLIEARAEVAIFDCLNRCRCQVDAASDDVTGFLAGRLEDFLKDRSNVAVLGANGSQVGMSRDIGS